MKRRTKIPNKHDRFIVSVYDNFSSAKRQTQHFNSWKVTNVKIVYIKPPDENHNTFKKPPTSSKKDTSVNNLRSSQVTGTEWKKDIQFQDCDRTEQTSKSDRNNKSIWWASMETLVERFIKRCKKMRPILMTQQAKDKEQRNCDDLRIVSDKMTTSL